MMNRHLIFVVAFLSCYLARFKAFSESVHVNKTSSYKNEEDVQYLYKDLEFSLSNDDIDYLSHEFVKDYQEFDIFDAPNEVPKQTPIKTKYLEQQQYVLLDSETFNHQQKIKRAMSEEYADLLYDRKPLADVVWTFIWKRIKPVTQIVANDISNRFALVVQKCHENCVCTWTTEVARNWLAGRNDLFSIPLNCPTTHDSSSSSPARREYDENSNNIFSDIIRKSSHIKIPDIKINFPLVPLVDISAFDTSIDTVDFEDQICFLVVKKAVDFAVGKFMDLFHKVSPF